MEGPLAGLSDLRGEPLQPHQVAQPLLDGELEVLAKESAVDVLLIGLDDGVRRVRRRLEWVLPLVHV